MLNGGGAALTLDADGGGGPDRAELVAALMPTLALAACGGGDGATAPAPTASAPVTVAAASVTTTQASRFLAQTTMGATKPAINDVVTQGFDGWLSAQFAMPRATTHWDWLVANGYNVAANINSETGYDATVWHQLIAEPDQLRQRVAFALLDMLVAPRPRSAATPPTMSAPGGWSRPCPSTNMPRQWRAGSASAPATWRRCCPISVTTTRRRGTSDSYWAKSTRGRQFPGEGRGPVMMTVPDKG